MSGSWISRAMLAPWLLWAVGAIAQDQAPGASRNVVGTGVRSESSSPIANRTLSGRVLNAMTGAPIPRALVNASGRAVLTDSEGRFTFQEFSQPQAYIRVTKPGFTESADEADGTGLQRLTRTEWDIPLELTMLPDGLVMGTVSGANGVGIGGVPVQLRTRRIDSGVSLWNQVGSTFTDAHGAFRILAPRGRYRISTSYSPRTADRGDAVLPVAYPVDEEFFTLGSGEERRIDLRARMGPPHALILHLEGAGPSGQVRLFSTAGANEEFGLGYRDTGIAGEYLVELPAGNYTIRAVSDGRGEPTEGTAKVVVAGGGTETVELALTGLARFSVELSREGDAGMNTSNDAQILRSLNLHLRSMANDPDMNHPDALLGMGAGDPLLFQVRPGRYRLESGVSGSGWYAKAASVGSSNLMKDELVVGPGAAGSSIRVILSNAIGRIHGTVSPVARSAPAWVYMVPEFDSLVPSFETYIQANGDFSWSGPVGSYRVAVLDHRLREDISDSVVRDRLLAGGRIVEVTKGADTTVNLGPAQPAEVPR